MAVNTGMSKTVLEKYYLVEFLEPTINNFIEQNGPLCKLILYNTYKFLIYTTRKIHIINNT